MSLSGTIVFSSGRTADFDIWTFEIDSGAMRQLTRGRELNDCPRWSPDGLKIAYISIGNDMISSLWMMNRDGTDKQRLTSDVHAQQPSWSPDGRNIVFTAAIPHSDEIEVCVFDLSSGQHEVLFQRKGHETDPSYSPDGQKLLFASIDPQSEAPFSHRDTEIWERCLRSGSERRICSHPARDYGPVYSPDGRRIAFVSHRNGRCEVEMLAELTSIKSALDTKSRASVDHAIERLRALELDSEICVVDASGENLREITKNEGADVGVRWSPCGNYLIFSASEKGKGGTQRLKIVEAESGREVPFNYSRADLKAEIGASPEQFLNQRYIDYLIPDFLEKPVKMWMIGSRFFGEERCPDWTAT